MVLLVKLLLVLDDTIVGDQWYDLDSNFIKSARSYSCRCYKVYGGTAVEPNLNAQKEFSKITQQ